VDGEVIETETPELTEQDFVRLHWYRMLDVVAKRQEREVKRLKHAEEQCLNAALMNRPCMVLQPLVLKEGKNWIAIRGDIVGRGPTPAEAMADFDEVFTNG
jgi:hypothetical protein